MRVFVTHLLCAVAGFLAAAFLFLFLSSLASLVWQNDIKIRAAFSLQHDGAKAAQEGDWSQAAQLFRASDNIQASIQPTRWDMSYPVHGWRLIGLVEYPDKTFSFPDLCIEAYSLKKQGKIEEANNIYAELAKAHPSKDQSYFDTVAEKTLAALSSAPPSG